MAKRYTDSEKWDDPFFTELPNEYKLLWIYILDKCDHAGIYKVNPANVEFSLKSKFNWEEVIKVLDGRIVVLSKEKWFVPKFIDFQYGELDINNRVHNAVYKILDKEGVFKGRQRPVNDPIYKDKDKDKDKYLDFVLLTKEEHNKLITEFGQAETAEMIKCLNNYGYQKPKKFKEYGSHYHTLLVWARKDNPRSGNLTKTQKNNLSGLKKTMERINNDKSKFSTGISCIDSGIPGSAI